MGVETEAIVCLPATLSGAMQWHGVRRLWTAPNELLTPDLVDEGSLLPDFPREEDYEDVLAREVAHLARTLDERERVHLVGHSYGGAVARRFAREHPGRVRTLTLVEPVCFELLRHFGPPDLVAEMHHLKELCRADRRERPLLAAERFVSYWGSPSAWRSLCPAARGRAARGMAKVVAGWDQLWNDVAPSTGREFPGPTLILCGAQSPAASRWITRFCAVSVFPASRYDEIEGAGHFAPVTHAAEITRRIEGLVNSAV